MRSMGYTIVKDGKLHGIAGLNFTHANERAKVLHDDPITKATGAQFTVHEMFIGEPIRNETPIDHTPKATTA